MYNNQEFKVLLNKQNGNSRVYSKRCVRESILLVYWCYYKKNIIFFQFLNLTAQSDENALRMMAMNDDTAPTKTGRTDWPAETSALTADQKNAFHHG